MFVCSFVAAAGNYSRFGFAAAWVGDFAAGWHVLADVQWGLFVADERSRTDGAGDSAAFARGCGSVRGIFQNDDADVPVCETDFVDDSAGPYDAAAERSAAAAFSRAAVSGFIE